MKSFKLLHKSRTVLQFLQKRTLVSSTELTYTNSNKLVEFLYLFNKLVIALMKRVLTFNLPSNISNGSNELNGSAHVCFITTKLNMFLVLKRRLFYVLL